MRRQLQALTVIMAVIAALYFANKIGWNAGLGIRSQSEIQGAVADSMLLDLIVKNMRLSLENRARLDSMEWQERGHDKIMRHLVRRAAADSAEILSTKKAILMQWDLILTPDGRKR